jgi:hypothetical protein
LPSKAKYNSVRIITQQGYTISKLASIAVFLLNNFITIYPQIIKMVERRGHRAYALLPPVLDKTEQVLFYSPFLVRRTLKVLVYR